MENLDTAGGQSFDPAQAAKLMGTYIVNKFAPVSHSSDEDSGAQSDDDEHTRKEKRRKKILNASRKKMAAVVKAEAQEVAAASSAKATFKAREFPRPRIEWECSMNPDPWFNSCEVAQETIQPTYTLAAYSTLRPTTPWNFSSLGLAPITDDTYKQLYRDPLAKWSKMETIVLLEQIRDKGLESDAVWKEIAAHPLLKLRHAEVQDCQLRFFGVLSLASLYGQSLTSPFARVHFAQQLAAYEAARAALPQFDQFGNQVVRVKSALPNETPTDRFNRLTGSNVAVPSAPTSSGRGGAAGGKAKADRASGRGKASGTRLSSRLQTKQRTKYTYSDDDDDFLLSEDSDAPPNKRKAAQQQSSAVASVSSSVAIAHTGAAVGPAGGGGGGGGGEGDEEFVMMWKIEKILACRHRRVRKGHEESSADESEIEASIIDSTANHSHRHRHVAHAETDAKKAAEQPAAAAATAAAASSSTTAMDTSTEPAAAPAAAAATEQKEEKPVDTEEKKAEQPAMAVEEKKQDAGLGSAASTATPALPPTAGGPAPSWRSIRRAQPTVSTKTGAERPRPLVTDPDYTVITEYLIKIEGQSYLHLEWHTVDGLKVKFGNNNRIGQRISGFHANQAEMEAQNLDRYGGEPFDQRYIEVDRIIASNMVDVEEEPEEKAAREAKNKAASDEYVAALQARQLEINTIAATDQAAAMQRSMQYLMQPLPQPIPVPQPKTKRVEMFLVRGEQRRQHSHLRH